MGNSAKHIPSCEQRAPMTPQTAILLKSEQVGEERDPPEDRFAYLRGTIDSFLGEFYPFAIAEDPSKEYDEPYHELLEYIHAREEFLYPEAVRG